MTGLSIAQLDWVYKRTRSALVSYRLALRQRYENVPPLSPHNMLCISIHWLRKGHPVREMEFAFNRSHQWLHTMITRVVPMIDQSIFHASPRDEYMRSNL